MLFHRKEGHSHRIFARRRQGKAEGFALSREEFMRDLNQQPGAVAGFGIASASAAMREIDQDLNSLLDNLMALLAANAGNEADPTGVMLEGWIVETLRRRQSVISLPLRQKMSPLKTSLLCRLSVRAKPRGWVWSYDVSMITGVVCSLRALPYSVILMLSYANDDRARPMATVRSRTDLYISLVQRFGVKSTIQNFDRGNGNFRQGSWVGAHAPEMSFSDYEHRKLAYYKVELVDYSLKSGLLR
jgi:hypothetical protein